MTSIQPIIARREVTTRILQAFHLKADKNLGQNFLAVSYTHLAPSHSNRADGNSGRLGGPPDGVWAGVDQTARGVLAGYGLGSIGLFKRIFSPGGICPGD